MTVKELKNQLEFYNDDLEVAVTVDCLCGMTHYVSPNLEMDELIQDDGESQKFLVIEPSI